MNRSVECANSVGTRKISSIRRRCSGTCAGATRLKSMSASLIASISGTSGGQAFSRTRIRSSSASNAPHGTSFFDGKYRKNVRRPIPAVAAISSTVVCSNPRSANRANAVCSSSAREVTRFRPGWPRTAVAAGDGTGITILAGTWGNRTRDDLDSGTWCR